MRHFHKNTVAALPQSLVDAQQYSTLDLYIDRIEARLEQRKLAKRRNAEAKAKLGIRTFSWQD